MSEITSRFDAQDWVRAHAVAQVAWERSGTSLREMFRRFVYHLDAWPCILQELKVPPVVGERHNNFSVNVSAGEHAMYCKLAQQAGLSQSNLGRALIFYHWELRQNYYRSHPDGELAGQGTLSFAPDRQQPWYDLEMDAKERFAFCPGESKQYILDWASEHGVNDEDVKELEWRLSEAAGVTEAYRWSAPYISPARLARWEIENASRRKYGIQALGDYWSKSIELPWVKLAIVILGLALSLAMIAAIVMRW